ncbi:MAG: precorrin-3B C(17)-methyltransferase [Leptolyngbyaceae cyanobacterium CRU_2_3]|nr:precorrin-3B C(17)-methyltransferase [Leptolyngbyaceae cyanobacterium CRU_2_3]
MSKRPMAIVVLGQASVPLARQLMAGLPEATLYGLAGRTTDVDVSFSHFGETVRHLFSQGSAIVGICATGILIRTLAPLLSDKRAEPPVLAIAEDGSAVVPLLGGLSGANEVACQIAAALSVKAAITATGKLRFNVVLENPPPGYRLANPDQAKSFTSDLLSGISVRLEGDAPWLNHSSIPFTPDGVYRIEVTESRREGTPQHLVYHPTKLAIALHRTTTLDADELLSQIHQALERADLSPAAVAGIFAPVEEAASSAVGTIAQRFRVPARFLTAADLEAAIVPATPTATDVAIAVTGTPERLISPSPHFTLAVAKQILDPQTIGQPPGRLDIIGTGPGAAAWMSPEVKTILQAATDLVGYKTYLDLVSDLAIGAQRHESDNRQELDRACQALDLAAMGRSVVVVSSGDPGIYAMAAAVFEVLDRQMKPEWQGIDIHVAPGISAMQAAAAAIGAPLGHDFCAISLSDLLKPWDRIEQRIRAAAQADFVIAFYNPVSSQRRWQLAESQRVLLEVRSPQTPVVLARNLGRSGQTVTVTSLSDLNPESADMRTVVLVGSSKTRCITRADGKTWVYTPRHYALE